MLRILFISTSGLKSDGITSWMRQTVSSIDRTGLQFEMVGWVEADPSVVSDVKAQGITVHLLPNRQTNCVDYLRALSRLLASNSFDIVHVCGSSGLMALELIVAKRLKVPVRVCHSHNTMCVHRLLDRILRPFMLRCATERLACGEDAGRWLFGDRGFNVVRNGRDLEALRFDSEKRKRIRRELGLSEDQIAVGHVGRFNEQKNHRRLIEVIAALRKRSDRYRLILVGDGALLDQVRSNVVANELEDSVLFLGRRDDVPDLLNAMDCMVLPSLYEGFPTVVVEWQANGLPCLVSDTVTRECAISSLVNYFSLNEPAESWAGMVESLLESDRARSSSVAIQDLKAAGYDSRESSAALRELYVRSYSESTAIRKS